MSDKSSPTDPDEPLVITLREFLRGGYQDAVRPIVVTYHARPLATWVPGVIDEGYSWTPGVAPRSTSAPALADPRPPMKPSHEIPEWLKPRTTIVQPPTSPIVLQKRVTKRTPKKR